MKRFAFIFLVVAMSFSLCSCSKIKSGFLATQAAMAVNNGNFKKAEQLYQEMIALEPNVAEHHWYLGTVYISTKEKEKVQKEIAILRRMGRDDLADQMFLLLYQPVL